MDERLPFERAAFMCCYDRPCGFLDVLCPLEKPFWPSWRGRGSKDESLKVVSHTTEVGYWAYNPSMNVLGGECCACAVLYRLDCCR